MRRALVKFNRLVAPTREMVSTLMRREHTVMVEDSTPTTRTCTTTSC